jgi:hypothetical protein
LTALKSTKAPGQFWIGTGGQYWFGANTINTKSKLFYKSFDFEEMTT